MFLFTCFISFCSSAASAGGGGKASGGGGSSAASAGGAGGGGGAGGSAASAGGGSSAASAGRMFLFTCSVHKFIFSSDVHISIVVNNQTLERLRIIGRSTSTPEFIS